MHSFGTKIIIMHSNGSKMEKVPKDQALSPPPPATQLPSGAAVSQACFRRSYLDIGFDTSTLAPHRSSLWGHLVDEGSAQMWPLLRPRVHGEPVSLRPQRTSGLDRVMGTPGSMPLYMGTAQSRLLMSQPHKQAPWSPGMTPPGP